MTRRNSTVRALSEPLQRVRGAGHYSEEVTFEELVEQVRIIVQLKRLLNCHGFELTTAMSIRST